MSLKDNEFNEEELLGASGGRQWLDRIDGLRKDDSFTVRLLTKLYRYQFHFSPIPAVCHGDECPICALSDEYEPVQRFACLVLNRKTNKPTVFRGIAFAVARALLEYKHDENKAKKWGGDYTAFDVVIKRSSGSGPQIYSVDPDPDTRRPLTDEESALVTEEALAQLAHDISPDPLERTMERLKGKGFSREGPITRPQRDDLNLDIDSDYQFPGELPETPVVTELSDLPVEDPTTSEAERIRYEP